VITIKEHEKLGTATAEVECGGCHGKGKLAYYLTPEQHAAVQELWPARNTPTELAAIRAALDLGVPQVVVARELGMHRSNLAIILRKARRAR
jgi:hypothetical protein